MLLDQIIFRIKNNLLIKNSLIFFLGTIVAGTGNYFFHFFMARLLTVKEFGELESLVSLSYLIGVLAGAIDLVVVKHTSCFKAGEENQKIYQLFISLIKKLIFVSFIFLIIFLFFTPYLAELLKLNSLFPLFLLGLLTSLSLFGAVIQGILRGLMKFKEISILGIVSVSLKLVLAVLFVKLSFAVNGAMAAIFLSGLIGYLIILWPLKFLFKYRKENSNFKLKEINIDIGLSFFILFFLNALYNLDVVLVKYFLSPEMAGSYSAVSVIGRVVFFISSIVISVMFPMAAEVFRKKGNHFLILRHSFLMISFISFFSLIIYFLFPSLIVKILLGSKYLKIIPYLGWFGLAMFFYSLVNLLSQYFFSIKKIKCLYFLAFGVILQTILISFFHQTLGQIILVMNLVMVFTLFLLLIYLKMVKSKLNFVYESENI